MAQETKESLDQALALIRSEYDGRLIICYHPSVEITNEGLKIKYQATTPDFASLCEKNKIEFVDVSEAFLDAYQKNFAVPYGFSNTTMGTGHLSREGHQIIADVLFDVLTSQNPILEAQQ